MNKPNLPFPACPKAEGNDDGRAYQEGHLPGNAPGHEIYNPANSPTGGEPAEPGASNPGTRPEPGRFNADLMFSSKTDLWATPQEFFDKLDGEFHFDVDVCALPDNAKCARYYTPRDDGLTQPWSGTCWCNPPYGRSVGLWVQRAAQACAEGSTVVMLLPARTDTRWFHEYLYQRPNVELRFLKGRLKFGDGKNSAPFPSLVAVFRPHHPRENNDNKEDISHEQS